MADYDEFVDELHRERAERSTKPTREGDYGHHLTYSGKVTYRRPKHFFTKSDWERIGRKFFIPAVEEGDKEAPAANWWMIILRNYTLDMMEDLFNLPGIRALNLSPEDIYQQAQDWGNQVGYKWAEKLRMVGRNEEADLVMKLFEQHTF